MARRRADLVASAKRAKVADFETAYATSPSFGSGESDRMSSLRLAREPNPALAIHRLDAEGVRVAGDPSQLTPQPWSSGPRFRRRNFEKWSRRYVLALVVYDLFIGALAAAVPAQFSTSLGGRHAFVGLLALVGAMVWPSTIALARGYVHTRVGVGSEELRAVLRAGIGVVVVGAFPAGLLGQETLLKLVVVGVPFAVLLSTCVRFATRKALHRRQGRGLSVRHVVVVGSASAAAELRARLDRETHCGMKVVGVCLPSGQHYDEAALGVPVLGDLLDVAAVVSRIDCDAVAVTSDNATRYSYLRKLAWSLEGTGVEMLVDPGLIEVAGPRMHIRPLIGVPLLHIEEPHFSGWRKVIKRGTDIVLTTLGLVVIFPLLLLIAVLIKLQDGGPVLFRQKRVGRGGQEFWMYKFRSMIIDADARKAALLCRNEGKGGLFKLTDDPRITPLGRILRDYSLDELPQLINVLNGTMSLVGPRPHLAREIAQMPSEASRRALVTPGLTGLWQVSGRSDLEGDDAIRLDLRYVENWNFTLDLLILWKTISAVLARRGAR
jgi:exopolysaccharide biosynthesis polyprenyl glycosylphosphotransferase